MKLLRIFALFPLAVLFLTPVHATTPNLVTGGISGIGTGTITESRTADGNTFITSIMQIEFTGGIQAQGTVTQSGVITSSGLVTVRGNGTFTGTVGGSASGSAEIHFTWTGQFVSMKIVDLNGQMTLGHGTAGLAGLHGQGTFSLSSYPEGPFVSYSVQVHFDPA